VPPTEDDPDFDFGFTNEDEFPSSAVDSAQARSANFDEYSENSFCVLDDNSLSPDSVSTSNSSSENNQMLAQPSMTGQLKVKVSKDDPTSLSPAKRRRRKGEDKPSILMADGKDSPTLYKIINGIREPAPSLKPSGLYFSKQAEARRSVERLNWEPPANDPSIPATDDDKASWVLTLRQAMEDMSCYADSESVKFQKRWLAADWVKGRQPQDGDTVTNPYHPLHWMEEKCWGIVVSTPNQVTTGDEYANHQVGAVHPSTPRWYEHPLLSRPIRA
jgi:hypothetical protein